MKDRAPTLPPGDRGRWYYQLLGIDMDGEPTTLQEVARDRDTTRTSQLVTGMWDQTSEVAAGNGSADPLAGWAPTDLSRKASSRRTIRLPIVFIAVILGLGAAFALWWLPQASEQRAAVHGDLMENSIAGLYEDLAGLQNALATVTEPASDTPELGTTGLSLSSVADSAARLLDVANAPVPQPLPLSPREPFDDLEAFRTGLEPLAAEATAIRSEVADIGEYRLALAKVLVLGELPLTADSSIINAQTAALAKILADSVAALNSMPTDGPFAGHRELVDAEISAFAQWQTDYLAALRAGDAGTAGELVEQLRLARDGLDAELIGTLAELRSDIDARILDLAERLNRAAALVPA